MSSHSLSDIMTTVKTKLDTKLNQTDEAASVQWNNVSNKPTTYNPSVHRHNWNEIDNKPAIPDSPRAYITKTWNSGNNWFRKYNDGWIEQGGTVFVSSKGIANYNFNTPFLKGEYTIVCNAGSSEYIDGYSGGCVRRSTTSTFDAINYMQSGTCISWYAAGY